MLDLLLNIAAFSVLFACIWWTALIVLAIKGLLFHRNKDAPVTDEPVIAPMAAEEEMQLPPPMPKGCLWTIIFIFWPMAVGQAIDAWLTARERAK